MSHYSSAGANIHMNLMHAYAQIMHEYEGKAVIGLCRNLIGLRRANGPPLAREATAGSLARRARQSNWSAPT